MLTDADIFRNEIIYVCIPHFKRRYLYLLVEKVHCADWAWWEDILSTFIIILSLNCGEYRPYSEIASWLNIVLMSSKMCIFYDYTRAEKWENVDSQIENLLSFLVTLILKQTRAILKCGITNHLALLLTSSLM